MTEPRTFQVGDRVTIDHPRERGRIFTVTRKLPKNYLVSPVAGGRDVRVSPELLQPAAEGDAGAAGPIGVPFEPIVILDAGQTVTLRGKPGIFVVLKSTPRGYSVALLGGDGGRYWNAPAASLTPVTVKAEIA